MIKQKINNDIKSFKVLLIDEAGQKIGTISTEEALQTAKVKGVDLVQVSEPTDNSLPVCKLMNFGQFNFEKKRRIKKNLKKDDSNHKSKTKIMRLSPDIGKHDLDSKNKKVSQWLSKNYTVKLTCTLRGIGILKKEEAKQIMQNFVEECNGKFDAPISLQGRMLFCVISKNKN